jgi:hypothetical protein
MCAESSPVGIELVLEALDMAAGQRNSEGTIHHSDQGSHTAIAFGQRCKDRCSPVDGFSWRLLRQRNVFWAHLPPSNANSSSAPRLQPDRRLALESSTSWKAGIIRIGCTRPSATSRRKTTKKEYRSRDHSQPQEPQLPVAA